MSWDLGRLYLLPYGGTESVARVMLVFDISCLLEAVLPVNPFDGEVVSTHGGPDNIHHLQQPPSFLSMQISQSCRDATSQYAVRCTLVEDR